MGRLRLHLPRQRPPAHTESPVEFSTSPDQQTAISPALALETWANTLQIALLIAPENPRAAQTNPSRIPYLPTILLAIKLPARLQFAYT